MPSTTPWNIPLFDGTYKTSIKNLLNTISNSLNSALNTVKTQLDETVEETVGAIGATVTLTTGPIVNSAPTVNTISGWSVNTSQSVRSESVLVGVSTSKITLKPGRYLLTAMVSLNNAGNPQTVNSRSFIEISAGEVERETRLRNNPSSNEDSWIVSGAATYQAETTVTIRLLAGMSAPVAGSKFTFIATRIG